MDVTDDEPEPFADQAAVEEHRWLYAFHVPECHATHMRHHETANVNARALFFPVSVCVVRAGLGSRWLPGHCASTLPAKELLLFYRTFQST